MIKNIFLCFTFLCLLAFPSQAQFYFEESSLVGQVAPDFTLPTLKKDSVNFTELRNNKKAVIFFWATWCPHCREQLKELSARQEELRSKGVQVILVDMGETADVTGSYLKKQKIEMDVFIDEQEMTGSLYQLIGVPTLVFVDHNGKIKAIDHALPDSIAAVFQ